ncbi:cell adhesion protein, partial [Clostridium botulinum]|nr:cell adhesion protein [Clostridium botulinum]
NYESITELEGKEILNQTDFETFGIDDLNLLTETINTQVVNGIDEGNLGNGKLFEIYFSNDFMSISEVK